MISSEWRNGSLYREFENRKTKKIIKVMKAITHHDEICFSCLKEDSDERFTFASRSWFYKNYKPINK